MAPFELLLLSALVATSAALPTSTTIPMYRGLSTDFTHPKQATEASFARFEDHQQSMHSSYQCFGGDSTISVSASNWLCFDDLWRINEATILSVNGGDTYIKHYVKEAIQLVADDSTVDSRLILALMMQESSGRASISCNKSQSSDGSRCGIMQASNGSSFDAAKPATSILQMVREGIGPDSGRLRTIHERHHQPPAWVGR